MIFKTTAAATAKINPFMLHYKKIVVDFSEVEKALSAPENTRKIDDFRLLDFSTNSALEAFKVALTEELENGFINTVSDFAFFNFFVGKIAFSAKINLEKIAVYKGGIRKYNALKISGLYLISENGIEINHKFSPAFRSQIQEIEI